MSTVKERLAQRAALVEQYLAVCLRELDIPESLRQAMDYSLLAGGKRLRPVLCLSFCTLLGGDDHDLMRAALPMAGALELIHTYSLVHDDLPAMDDDDLRRGMPSNHKKFGEAMGILAGDGLLTEAFGLMCRCVDRGVPALNVVMAMAQAARSAGARGMVGGQVLDMAYTGRSDVPLEDLRAMHARKTGALITGACKCGALMALDAGDPSQARHLDAAEVYGWHLGAAFQIVDDVLDVVGDQVLLGKPVGSDEAMGKTTYPGLLGLDESRRLARKEADAAVAALAAYSGEEADFLRDLAEYVVDRAC